MKRDVFKTAQKGYEMKDDRYDMTCVDMYELYDRYRKTGEIYDLIYTTFNYGYVLGARAKAKELKK